MLTTGCCFLHALLAATASGAFRIGAHPPPSSTHHPSLSSSSRHAALRMSSGGDNRDSSRGRVSSANASKRTRPQVDDVLYSISEPPTFPYSVDPTDLPPGAVSSDPLVPLVHTIVMAADKRKASDIVAMRVTSCTSLTNFVVIVSGTSRPQNQAISNAISRDVSDRHDGMRCLGNGIPEGNADSGWILLDYGDVMVHVMTPKSRLFYDMDGIWRGRGGEYLDLTDVLVDEGGGGRGEDGGMMMDNVSDVEDEDYDDDEDEEHYGNGEEEVGRDDNDGPSTKSMRERLDVEREIDPFWS
ncbi:hypothetical protein ACHAXA_005838 [Cyclostephanos tholiformis]|uniref:Uncharacterized protein n=1 Tax=Cyclostephanos tholiformis TaxID=382380 RepID=A0ABD3RW91_9STRA